ncbi:MULTISPECIES: GMC family oxidoreductase N-terminal domain-containing protein [unclassified Mesorhizobium]|uniref:GMC family oxidoreductase n=1 Tax=unclassified Mesorhizobium TaxID=325217 RepID=UPI000FDC9BBF|nr:MULTISPECIES: GMC family oxidoreductase N-terminal domain-containing protein [unclassified Mesorhizobium]TGQ16820.1 alcohol dehydrogenase [Mesorhizobium sp. M2E.F.Ca.ET.219.01.1.1]TGT77087.1 alcohol dehydrogenase [Mesorhizobium sp. M2E.F.Ca.ET.166.01.1.1]TGW03195.1 alcohol dehydrogenase [Mesorhizobium sp. M2E.F.Ca.ET.154.01.1.1]
MQTESFDYIVVGAGSAGCVVANRLSADPSVKVCLIEAGGSDNSLRVKVPAGILSLYGNPNYDYCFVGVPQPQLNNRSIPVNRGKALGGSSSINSMVYIRGAAEDYDEWAGLGCAGWAYRDVLPVFRKLECNLLGQDSRYHGSDGELLVDNPRDPNVLSSMFVKAGKNADLPANADFNAESQYGLGIYNVTQDRGQRFSSFSAFMRPVLHRKNLTLLSQCEVIDLVIAEGRATGLRIRHQGQQKTLSASREIVLSAGAINSPRILMASGIGSAAELQAIGIAPVLDLPGVGKNLQDHVDGMITVRSRSTRTLGLSLANLPRIAAAPFQYFARRKGMLTTNYVEAGGFAKTRYTNGLPDIQFHFVPGYRSHRGRLIEYGHGYAIHTCVLRPKSVGEIRLSRDNSRRDVLIDHRFFTHEDDAMVLVEGIKIARRIFASPEFDSVRGKEMLPGKDVSSDDEILAYLCAEALTVYHPVGTCKMGTDDMAVVDPATLKVRGVEGLRVADASVMPKLIGGNTNAPSMMIGQKASEMILGSARNGK